MDEITFKPTPKAENEPKKTEKANFEMAPIVSGAAKTPEEVSEPEKRSGAQDINALMEAEKKERQRLKAEREQNSAQTTAEAVEEEVPPPTPKKPQGSEKSSEKIIEIMLSPPSEKAASAVKPASEENDYSSKKNDVSDEAKKEQTKPSKEQNKPVKENSTRSEDITESEADKAAPAPKKNRKKNAESNIKAEAVAPVKKDEPVILPDVKPELVKEADAGTPAEIESISIPSDLSAKADKIKPVVQQTQESAIESISIAKPVFVDVDANVAQATEDESYNEEYQRLMKMEETDSLSPDEKRRLQIIRLIELKRKGKSNPYANNNLVTLMSEEISAGHDVSKFDKVLAEISGATPPAQSSAPAQPVHKSADIAPVQTPAKQQTAPKQTSVKQEDRQPVQAAAVVSEKKKSPVGLIIGIVVAAVVIIGVIIGIMVLGGGKDNNDPSEQTTTEATSEVSAVAPVTEETTEATTAVTTEKISAGNIVEAKVTSVDSGDTIDVEIDGQAYTVNLIGIKAPTGKETYAKESTAYVKKIIGDKIVTLEFDLQINNDKNNLLAYVWYNDGKTLFNDELLALGYAKTELSNVNKKFNDEFTKTETSAKTEKVGLWAPKTVTTQKQTTTTATAAFSTVSAPYVSRNMKVFHKNSCPLAYDSAYGKGLFTFQTREEAIELGCGPCAQCNP